MLRFTFAVAALVLTAAAPAPEHQWKPIQNATFGFSACYPADVLHADGNRMNVGGQRYVGQGGAELTISGLANPEGDSLAVTAQQTIPNSFGLKRNVTYKVIRPNWAVLSGTLPDGRVFYQRVIRKQRDYAFFFLTYPKGRAPVFAPMIGRLAECLR